MSIHSCAQPISAQFFCSEYSLDAVHIPLDPNISGLPDLSGLTPTCQKAVLFIYTAARENGMVVRHYRAMIKEYVTRERAEQLMYSPELNGTEIFGWEEKMWKDDSIPSKSYVGSWNLTQLCYLENLPEVRYSRSLNSLN
jgi:hypothetical protein